MPDLTPPFDDARDHVRGDGSAPVTLLVYGDYECPYTRMAYRSAQELERRLGPALRFAFRHFPLTEIHPHAEGAAAAAEAAAAQGRFWAMHDVLFHRQRALAPPDLRRYAAELGLDVERFEADLAAGAGARRIREDVRSGVESGVRGTPTLFVNDRRHSSSYDADSLEPALRSAA